MAECVQRMRPAMGSWLTIEACAPLRAQALEALHTAFVVVETLEGRLHPRREGSELARISDEPLAVPQTVAEDTWALLKRAQRIHALSAGVFDPCLPCRPGTLGDLELGLDFTVVCHAPLLLDLGGMAKGHAIDLAVAALKAHGCTSGLVNAGGDLRAFGERAQVVMLRRADGACEPLTILNEALAVSDLDGEGRPSEHQGYYVRGAQPVGGPRHAAVLAPDAARADALTKCVLLCPPAVADRVLDELGARRAVVDST